MISIAIVSPTLISRFYPSSLADINMVDQADPIHHESWSFQLSLAENLIVSLFKLVNKYIPWHKLPTLLGTFNLLAFRFELRAKNLYDGYATKEAPVSYTHLTLPTKRIV